MILVDTSTMIEFLRGADNPKTDLFERVQQQKIPFGICGLIYLEVLQGARSEREFDRLREYLYPLPFFELPGGAETMEATARMNIRCREKGVTVRSTLDLLIARTAIEHNLFLLHNDRDYDEIAAAIPELKILQHFE